MINIIFSSDNNFAQHLGVTLCSLFENNKEEDITIYVIDGEIKSENKEKLAQIEKKYSFKINYIEPDKKLFKDLYISGHISVASYYRLGIGEFMPLSAKKVLYFDCDIIIVGKIEKIWNQDITSFTLGAITEAGQINHKNLGIKEKEDYFNAGILLIDLSKWREQKIGKQCFDFIKNNPDKIILHDQDTLNGVFRGDWKKLDARFNVMTQNKNNVKDPVIIHYNTWVKPWNYLCNNPHKYLYDQYLSISPWKDYKPKFPSLKDLVKYYYYTIIDEENRVIMSKYILVPLGLKKK